MHLRLLSFAFALGLAASGASWAQAPAPRGAEARVIVKLKPAARDVDPALDRVGAMAARRGVALQRQRELGAEVRLVTARGMGSAELARRLAADPEVAYAVPDRRMRSLALPNDPLYTSGGAQGPVDGQWYLRAPNSLFRSAIDAQTAWDSTRGSPDVVVAVLDTGVRFDHPDLGRVASGGKLLPGYDFVRQIAAAGDGNGRDADASDPGDFVTRDDLDAALVADPGVGLGADCDLADSSWHGTQVAGIVGALTDNGQGMAGAGWDVRLLPLRVLGKCGGFESDVVAAMRWGAGIAISGLPSNPNPAQVLNLSLGGLGACGAAYTDAVADVRARGVAVVASAGNSAGGEVSAPANCDGVIGVAGLRHAGTKVGFSDLGPEVAISAPGGNCVFDEPAACLYPLLTATDSGGQGPQGPAYTDGFNITVGTSFAAPLVSGAAALALSVQPRLTPDELLNLLQVSARPFPTSGSGPGVPQCTAPRFTAGGAPVEQLECYCTTATCGAGMLDARAAVQTALGPIVRIALGSATPRATQALTLDAGGTLFSAGRGLSSVLWQIVDGGGIVSGINGAANLPTLSVTPGAGGSFSVRVTVTDTLGAVATATQRVDVAGPSSGGGGGGALGVGWLLALAGAVLAARRAARPAALSPPDRR